MKYELAKQLKEAGYKAPYARTEQYYSDVNIPTLSELIEACGDKFYALNKLGNPFPNEDWCAEGETLPDSMDFTGSTPEEAVAKLWLELNKK